MKRYTGTIRTQCSYCRMIGHSARDCPKQRSISRVRCYRCGLIGHIARDCDENMDGRMSSSGESYTTDGWSSDSRQCFRCGLIGHIARYCDTNVGGPTASSGENCTDRWDCRSSRLRSGGRNTVCVKKRVHVQKVEKAGDCFIPDFDPAHMGNGGRDLDDDDGGVGYKVRRPMVCVKKGEDLKKVEEVEDCFILEFNPTEPLKFSNLSLCEKEDVSVLAEKGQVACRDYPHPRHLCATHPFKKTPHALHCKMCYCYVCDKPAPCKRWTGGSRDPGLKHCDATDDDPMWTIRRDRRKSRPRGG